MLVLGLISEAVLINELHLVISLFPLSYMKFINKIYISLDITEKPVLSYNFKWLRLQNITNNIFLMLKNMQCILQAKKYSWKLKRT